MSFVHDCIRLATIRQKRTIKRASSDRATVQCCRLCRVEQLDQLQTDLEENAGNWAREVKPLMRQGKHSSDVCFPLPNVPATSVKHFTIAPPLSARLPSPYQRLGEVGASWRCNQLSCFLAYAHEKYEKSICTWIALINVHHI